MTFHVDAKVFAPGENRIARLVYFDQGFGKWELRQGGLKKMATINGDSGQWAEKEVLI